MSTTKRPAKPAADTPETLVWHNWKYLTGLQKEAFLLHAMETLGSRLQELLGAPVKTVDQLVYLERNGTRKLIQAVRCGRLELMPATIAAGLADVVQDRVADLAMNPKAFSEDPSHG